MEPGSGLTELDFVADSLQPLQLIVWGELAIHYLGVPVVHKSYMIGVRDDEMSLAAEKLASAGFVRQEWSFSSIVDPASRKDDKLYERAQANIRPAFANFDEKTMRFYHPDKKKYTQRTVIIPTSYIRLSVSQAPSFVREPSFMSQPPFYVHGNLHYPNAIMLLYSIIMAYREEKELSQGGHWQARLAGWAFGYLYGELSLRDDVLDGCTDEAVKECFDEEIKRGSGISRVREKFGRPRAPITNEFIEDFQ